MAKTDAPAIHTEEIEIDGEARLWDVMRAALRAKEAEPSASMPPAMLILKSNEIVATVYESREEPRTLLVRTCTGIRKISVNVYDGALDAVPHLCDDPAENGRHRRNFPRRAQRRRMPVRP